MSRFDKNQTVIIQPTFQSSSTRTTTRNFFILLALLFFVSVLVPKGKDVLWINGHHTPFLDTFFSAITNLGDGVVLIPIAIVTLFTAFRHFFALVLSGVALGLIMSLFKHVLFRGAARPRLFIDTDLLHFVQGVKVHSYNTFPSGHTATAFCVAMAMILVFRNKTISTIALLIALLVGYSRIYLAQHFLMDVAAGAIVGGLTTFIIWQLFENNQTPGWMNRKLVLSLYPKLKRRKGSVNRV